MSELQNSWVILQLLKQQYGIRTECVREMVQFSEAIQIPGFPEYMRGIINLRGQTMPVMDLRRKLSMQGFWEEADSIIELLKQREQDHINWLTELMSSISENREFKLARDPHLCAFGKWYDSFKTDDPFLRIQLSRFDDPHKRIHGIADVVTELNHQKKHREAVDLINQTRNNELSKMVRLFQETREMIKGMHREIVMIVEDLGRRFGIVVDSVSEVLDIPDDQIEPPPAISNNQSGNLILGLAKVEQQVKILLDASKLLEVDEYKQVTEGAVIEPELG